MAKQIIDMGGFENDSFDVKFGDEKYDVPLDPPIEVYRQFLKIQNLPMDKDEDWEEVKDFIVTLFSLKNKVDKKFLKSKLNRFNVRSFLTQYDYILSESSGLKNFQSLLMKKAMELRKKNQKKSDG